MAEEDKIQPATAQERNVFALWKKNKNDTGINLAFGFKTQNLNVDKLEYALNQIIVRHDRLRSSFCEENECVIRKISENCRLFIEHFASKNLSDFIRPFNLEKAPLLRVAVQGETVLIDICHIVTDGFSMAVFFSELNMFYSGQPVRYNPTPIPPDNESELSSNTEFWASQFKNPFLPLRLPADKKGNAGLYGGDGSSLVHCIESSLTRRVQKVCRELSVTPFVFYFSAFMLFLAKESALDDVVTATNLSCRSPRTMRSIGLLARVAPVRFKLPESGTVKDFLLSVSLSVKSALLHQQFDTDELLARMGFSDLRDFSRTIFTFEHERIADIRLDGKKCEFVPIPSRHSASDLTLCFFPFKNQGLILSIFRTDLFSHQQIRKFLRHYEKIIESFLHIDESIKSIL